MSFLYPIKMHLLRTGKRLIPRVRPSFIIIGAQKCGTTSLFHYLSNHPSLMTPRIKEVDFFDADNRYARSTSFYHSYFPARTLGNRRHQSYEATPGYMGGREKTAKSARRLKEYNPSIKLVAILRNPVVRAYSAWQMYRGYYRKNPDWYFNWMKRDLDSCTRDTVITRPPNFGQSFLKDIRFEIDHSESSTPIESSIIEWGQYGMALKHYFEHFTRDQIHILFLEDLAKNPAQTLAILTDFLELEPHDWQAEKLAGENTGDYSDSVPGDARDLLTSIYKEDVAAFRELVNVDPPWPDFV